MENAVEHTEGNKVVQTCDPAANDDSPRVLVVGAGPTGVRFTQELLKRQPNAKVTLFGNEPYLPYNRVQLSALLAGDVNLEDITTPLPQLSLHPYFVHINAHILRIDTDAKKVVDTRAIEYPYDHLVIATGSRPHVPHIPGTEQTGVYTFRNLKDTESLYGRVARARHVVIVGGGLLGLEAGRALQRANTKVTIVQQGQRLMNRQLDENAASYLGAKVTALGIKVITNSGVRQILGEGRVTGVVTRDGDTVECDTVLLCAGIKPAIELARDARIKVTNGILVDDQLRTSAEGVYAIGECCEHRGKTYGLVNPGFEQAAICADVMTNGSAHYVGSLEVSRLKVLGETVCSMGEVADLAPRPFLHEWVYNNQQDGIYRKVVTYKGRLIGAVGFGDWPEIRRIQEAYQNSRQLYPWHYLRFILTGYLWGDSANDDPNLWPATTIVCQCNNISQGDLVSAVGQGAATVTALSIATSAGTVCGSCKPLLEKLVGDNGPREPEKTGSTLLIASLAAMIVAAVVLFLPAIQVSDSVQSPAFLEPIWNDKFWKQVTGFTLLGLSAVGLFMSLRKRIKNDRFGQFAYWRVLHVLLGAACTGILVAHTGLNLGENLNRWLMIDFLAVLFVGAIAGITIALSHRFTANFSQKIRRFFTWVHILAFWPLPALLAVHVLTVYYF